jgi:hypothetical protein
VLVPDGITWYEAKEAAESMGGYLATIASAEENEFVFKLMCDDDRFWSKGSDTARYGLYYFGPWIGGYQLDLENYTTENHSDNSMMSVYLAALDPTIPGNLEDYRKGAEVGWLWVTGEPMIYSDWGSPSQPDNIGRPESEGNFESRLHYWWSNEKKPTWNDLSAEEKTKGFIVEFAQTGTESSVIGG